MKQTMSKYRTMLIAALLPLSACAVVPDPGPRTGYDTVAQTSPIVGELTYYQRIALPQGSVATVRLLDTARADAAGVVLNEKLYDLSNINVPFAFSLDLPDSALEPQVRPVVRAEIRSRTGTLLWTTDTAIVLEKRRGTQNVGRIVMAMVQQGG